MFKKNIIELTFSGEYNRGDVLITWLYEIIKENKCEIEDRVWILRNNPYVVYKEVRNNSDGFIISYLISSYSKQHIDFVRYLFRKRIDQIIYLYSCFKLTSGQNLNCPVK